MTWSGRTVASMVVLALSSWSCGSTAPEATPVVAAIVVSPVTSTLVVDAQLPLQAQVRDETGAIVSDATVTWTVQNPDIVSVSEAGVVKALAVGTSQVAANALGKFGISIITVNPSTTPAPADPGSDPGDSSPNNGNPAPVATVSVTAPSTKLVEGSTMQLIAAAKDDQGNLVADQRFVWSSSNTDKATVSATGVVTGFRPGEVTITAQAGGKSGSVVIEVKKR
jgi:uncharacterized protein YjdB